MGVQTWNSVPIPARVAERAYTRVEKTDDGCWISTYSVGSHEPMPEQLLLAQDKAA